MENVELKLNVYDDDDKIIKSCEGHLVDIKFGVIRSLMKLLKVDDIKDTWELFKIVDNVWTQLTKILERCFPEMEEEDWDNIKLNELIPILLLIIKYASSKMSGIPTESKNLIAE